MSDTRKDSRRMKDTVIEVVLRDDGDFDLLLDHSECRSKAPESEVNKFLCVRFGFCGGEYDSLMQELRRVGRITIRL
jgi:hypothetical protein